ncbi:hypothetical protein QQF64_023660 [Cirrhinus molitorella]|uniref:AIG1-type G domain-containing protein n=1 Tax=Cirrhinus molitorella TaxID=172907 RepID=A0ABR3NJP5_9TELE
MSKLLMRKNTHILAQESQSVRVWSDVELHGHLITLVKLPALNRLSEEKVMNQTLLCVSLCHPGVHVFLLIMPDAPLTDESKAEIEKIQKIFDSREHFILLFTSSLSVEEHVKESIKSSLETQSLINLYGDQYRVMGSNEHENSRHIPELLDYIESMKTEPYSLQMYVKAQENRVRHELEEQHKKKLSEMENKFKEFEQNIESEGSIHVKRKKMNLVLCGSDERLKMSISKLIKQKKDKLHFRQISLVELPALNQLSEEEVMCQAHQCISLCDPGVHVFLLIIPDGPLMDGDKAENEEIQKTFSSRIKKHLVVLKIKEKNMFSKLISKINPVHSSDTHTGTSIQTFEDRCIVLENSSQIPDLLQVVENIVKQNKGGCYTTLMFLQAQVELERNKHKAKIEELRSAMKTNGVPQNCDDGGGNEVRIVMLGKTGVGKSATANNILRKIAFKSILAPSSVTKECEKETSEFNRRRITVIDTPGLFDTGVDNVERRKEIAKCISMAAPGPHVFLLVIQLGRFTQEEKDAVKTIQGIKDQTPVCELLDKIDCMLSVNGGSFYTNEMFQQVEKNIKEEQERILKEKEEEIKRREEELRAKYEAEIEQMKKENERQKQEMQNILRKNKREFKKREEEIKKETDENVRKELQIKLEKQQKEFEENKRKEKSLAEQQENFIKYLEERHEKEKLKLQEKIQHETR